MSKIIIASNRLPIIVGKTIRRSPGGLTSAMDGLFDDTTMIWVGWPGAYPSTKRNAVALAKRLRRDFNYVPVYLTAKEIESYYHGFSNACLWPILHYFPHYIHYSSTAWDGYVASNKKFAERIAEEANDHDLIWVHDYHLLLVPQMLRQINPRLKIGFFLHTPFPSFEVFRCLPHREELLRGILNADLIGFHTYGYLRHFRSSLIRLLNIDSDVDVILHEGRQCKLGVFPIGINRRQFIDELGTEKFRRRKASLQSMYAGHKVVLSIERVDYTKGILRRFAAIEKFLRDRKNKTECVFIFIGIPTRGEVKEYKELLDQIQKKVGWINGQFSDIGYTPVQFINKVIPMVDLCALYSVADVLMVTPLIDGMNLVAKEYLACKDDQTGVLILSEFTGAAHELFSALLVNPYDIDQVAKNLEIAVRMAPAEKARRLKGMREHVLKYDASYWARIFLAKLKEKKKKAGSQSYTNVGQLIKTIRNLMKNAGRVAFFLDYDGTLREFEDLPHEAVPTDEIMATVSELARLKHVDVFIVSGRRSTDMEGWFKGLPVTLVAEHGFMVLPPRSKTWHFTDPSIDLSWKQKVTKIFSQYVSTTPGTFIEEKMSSVVWHFRKADPEFGKWKAQQLIGNVLEILANENVIATQGQFIVEVSSNEVNKGAIMRHFMHKGNYKGVVCAGDDKTDEAMFKRSFDPHMISIKVGKGETFAKYRLSSPRLLRRLLRDIIRGRKRSNG